MNKTLKIFILFFILLLQNSKVNSQYLDYCTSYGATYLNYPKYSDYSLEYYICTDCVADPNRSINTSNCTCDTGYFNNGSQCISKYKLYILLY